MNQQEIINYMNGIINRMFVASLNIKIGIGKTDKLCLFINEEYICNIELEEKPEMVDCFEAISHLIEQDIIYYLLYREQ